MTDGRKGTILLVEDNPQLNESNRRALGLRGYAVLEALSLAAAREQLSRQEPDIILLDVMLPDGDGFAFCEEIQGQTTAHILFLTARTEHESRVRGLTGGGDDYITKPFHPAELLARIDAVMRRREKGGPPQAITCGAITMDIIAGRAYVNGADMLLKPKEYALLLLLVKNAGRTVASQILYRQAWHAPMNNDSRTLRKHMSIIRKQLEDADSDYAIVNDRGEGYRLTLRREV